MKVDQDTIRWFRLRRSGLVEHFSSPTGAAQALVGVQAQMLPAAGLALFNRSPGVTEALLDDMLHESRTLVRLWGQRGTLHVYASGDWPLVVASQSRRLSDWEGGPRPFGLAKARYQRLVDEVEDLLRGSESLGRKGLMASGLPLPESCYNPWGGIYAVLVMRGLACHVRRAGGEGRFAHRNNWLPGLEWSSPSYDEANTELVRRYAHTYGPVEAKDLAWWLGARVTEARRWLGDLECELTPVEAEGGEAFCLRKDVGALRGGSPAPGRWPLVMLYRFDPLLVGYKDRSWIIDDEHNALVSRPAGHIEGVVLGPGDGRACATWRYVRAAAGVTVRVSPFKTVDPALKRGIKARALALAGYFGAPLKGVAYDRPSA